MFHGPVSPVNPIYWPGYRPGSGKDPFPLFTAEFHGNPTRLLIMAGRLAYSKLTRFCAFRALLLCIWLFKTILFLLQPQFVHRFPSFQLEVSASDFSFLRFIISLARIYLIEALLFTSVRNLKKTWIFILPGFTCLNAYFLCVPIFFPCLLCLWVNWWGNIPQWSLV